MNAGKQEGDTKNHGHFLNFAYLSECMYVCVCVFYLLWYPGNVPRRRFVSDSSPSEFGQRQREDPSELVHHGCIETIGQTGERTDGKVGVRDRSERQTE